MTRRRATAMRGLLLGAMLAALGLGYTNDIVLTNTGSLAFGQLVAGGGSGAVIVAPSGARSSTGSVTLGNSSGARAAAFSVTGDVDATYSITLPSSASLDSGVNSMTIDTFTHDAQGVLVGGSESFHVGAKLHVAAMQPSGEYSGNFSVIVTYD